MCGIFAIYNDPTHQAAQTTLEGLKILEYRGYDSWGVAITNNQTITIDKHIGKIGEATTQLPSSSIAIGHTRWATHGGVTEANAHPHLSCDNQLAIIHNGIVENYEQLKKQLPTHHFSSETDSEVIVHLIEEAMKNKNFFESSIEVFSKIQGSNAFVALSAEEQQIIACKNGSPLLVGQTATSLVLASDIQALPTDTLEFYPLENNEGVQLSEQGLMIFDCSTQQQKQIQMIPFTHQFQKSSKGDFDHFMIKEIMEEGQILQRLTIEPSNYFQDIFTEISKAHNVFIIGCGSAYHAGLIGEYLLAKQGVITKVIHAHEFASFLPIVDEGSIVIAISQSGETADTLLAVQSAKDKGATIISIINNMYSSLVRLSHRVIPVNAGAEISVVSTKAFIAQVVTLFQIAHANNFDQKFQALQFVEVFEKWIDEVTPTITNIAKKLVVKHDIFMIGKSINYPVVLETALKMKESSYVHAEGFAAGELKHGVLTLIENGTPCLVFCSDDEFFQDTLSGAMEISARGGEIIGISPNPSPHFTHHIPVPQIPKLEFVFHIVVGQLLGYYMAIEKNLDPDKPRNLAKSVTVK